MIVAIISSGLWGGFAKEFDHRVTLVAGPLRLWGDLRVEVVKGGAPLFDVLLRLRNECRAPNSGQKHPCNRAPRLPEGPFKLTEKDNSRPVCIVPYFMWPCVVEYQHFPLVPCGVL